MSSTMTRLNDIVNMVIIAIVSSAFIVGALGFYLIKIKKVMAKEEKVNYNSFSRRDATEFVKFDNLINCNYGDKKDSYGVMVVNKHTFIAALDVIGYNFGTASYAEKERTIINSVAFTNTIDDTITMRQSVKAIDLSHNIEKQEQITKDYALKQLDLEQEYKETLALAEENIDDDKLMAHIDARIKELQRAIVSTRWFTQENENILNFMKGITSSGNAEKINQIILSYVFNPNEYVEELDESEMYLKACSEIMIKANNYISLLGNCGCTCRLLNGMELLDLIRRHNHPFTCDDIKIQDLFNSSYNALFVSSDSILRAERDRLGEKKYKEMLSAMNNKMAQSYRKAMTEAEELTNDLSRAVQNYVSEEQGANA